VFLLFYNKYVLILRRYQLYLASARTRVLQIHAAKKGITKKEKSHYSDYFLAEAVPKTAPEVQFLPKRCLQEGNSAQAQSFPDHRS
jgi:hypothetical protein